MFNYLEREINKEIWRNKAMLEKEIQGILDSNSLLDMANRYTIMEKKRENLYLGRCPFHFQDTSTFLVDTSLQEFHCIECGRKGNAITFAEYCNMTFPQIMGFFKIEKPAMDIVKRNIFYGIYNEAAKYYYLSMKNTEKGYNIAYKYFHKERGISDNIINKFGLGFADRRGLYNHLRKAGYKDDIIFESGLCIKSENGSKYDYFRSRVMIPIIDAEGRICGFGGRTTGDAKPKYINSSESIIFDKSRILFGLNFAKESSRAGFICCEGYMDTISLHQYGFDNAVASLGTAFTIDHATILKNYTDIIWLAYDSDEAGVNATLKNIELLREVGINAKVINMLPYKDPDEFLKNLGSDEFEKRISEAKDGICFEIDYLYNQYKNKINTFKKEVTKKLLTVIRNTNDINKYVVYVNNYLR